MDMPATISTARYQGFIVDLPAFRCACRDDPAQAGAVRSLVVDAERPARLKTTALYAANLILPGTYAPDVKFPTFEDRGDLFLHGRTKRLLEGGSFVELRPVIHFAAAGGRRHT